MAQLDLQAKIDEAAAAIRAITPIEPKVGMVLGSGLGGASLGMRETVIIDYDRIPHIPSPSVAGHGGQLFVGYVGDIPVAVLSGRVHLYEGWSIHDVTMGVRTLARLGVETLVVTNASGTTRASVRPGSLVLITDHLNLTGEDPTRGPEPPALGDRFQNMTDCYDPRMRELMGRAAEAESIELAEGVYAASKGPCYETPAEVRMLASMGADLVGMSTVPEAIAARHMGLSVAGVSCVTNLAAGIEGSKPNHQEVAQIAGDASERLARLMGRFLQLYGE